MGGSRRLALLLATIVAAGVIELGLILFKPKPDLGDYETSGSLGEEEEPQVQVKFSGIEPRRQLRYEASKGPRSLSMTTWDDATVTILGQSLAANVSEARLDVKGKITAVEDDGSFHWKWKISDVHVASAESSGELAAPGYREAIEGLKGLKGGSHIDAWGYVLSSRLDGGGEGSTRDLRLALALALNEPLLHLPGQAIGERAIWEVHREQTLDGVSVTVREQWELSRWSDDELEVELRGQLTAPPQDLLGEAPFGLSLLNASVRSFSATGEGSWTFGMTGTLPVSGEGWLDRTLVLELGMQGLGDAGLDLRSRSESVLESRP